MNYVRKTARLNHPCCGWEWLYVWGWCWWGKRGKFGREGEGTSMEGRPLAWLTRERGSGHERGEQNTPSGDFPSVIPSCLCLCLSLPARATPCWSEIFLLSVFLKSQWFAERDFFQRNASLTSVIWFYGWQAFHIEWLSCQMGVLEGSIRALLRDSDWIFSYFGKSGSKGSCHREITFSKMRIQFWLLSSSWKEFSIVFQWLQSCAFLFKSVAWADFPEIEQTALLGKMHYTKKSYLQNMAATLFSTHTLLYFPFWKFGLSGFS